jgi:hypothetical protein
VNLLRLAVQIQLERLAAPPADVRGWLPHAANRLVQVGLMMSAFLAIGFFGNGHGLISFLQNKTVTSVSVSVINYFPCFMGLC